MPAPSRASRLEQWLDKRVDVSALRAFIAHKSVPQHRHSIWYFMGGMTLFLFFVQITTGILLLLYYRPSAEGAYESVRFIMTDVKFGWLVRSIHSWSANLMIFFAFVHLFSVYLLKAYRPPREMTWLSGILMLFLALGFGFSGYLLPWNQLAYFATKVGTEIPGQLPVVGPSIMHLLRGGEHVSGATLTRFFGFHVAVLPMLTTALLLIHLGLVQTQGMSRPIVTSDTSRSRSMPFFPNFLLRDLLAWLVALGILVTLASLFPWELGTKADPLAPAPAGIRPEWYFLFMFQTLKFIPAKILGVAGELVGILAFGLGGLLLVLVPFLDRRAAREQPSRLFTLAGVVVILYMLTMTALGFVLK